MHYGIQSGPFSCPPCISFLLGFLGVSSAQTRAWELIMVLPSSFLVLFYSLLVRQCVACLSRGGGFRLAALSFFLLHCLLRFLLQWTCCCWRGCFTLYPRVSEPSPQSYGIFILGLKRSDARSPGKNATDYFFTCSLAIFHEWFCSIFILLYGLN